MSDIVNVTRIMQDILNIIKYSYKIDFNEESVYYRFVTHFEIPLHKRILNRLTYEDDNEDVFEVLKISIMKATSVF